MVEEVAFENGRIFNFQGLLTLTLDRIILQTVVHHTLASTYTPNFIEIEETSCGRTDGRTSETHFIRWTQKSRPNNNAQVVNTPTRPFLATKTLCTQTLHVRLRKFCIGK